LIPTLTSDGSSTSAVASKDSIALEMAMPRSARVSTSVVDGSIDGENIRGGRGGTARLRVVGDNRKRLRTPVVDEV